MTTFKQTQDKLEKFVDAANEYGGIEYNCNCLIKDWDGDRAIVTLED
ncbi:hypothetical protein KAR91_54850 [Candidatus Pacearchaeota archaeon]|nr:hypothetical protein [Candidatus Pacearchaeota archaeon]